ncbi:MAG: carboxypeptidase-like regulatory domain-containing protein [Chitinophagaceae bacterium]
MAKDQHIHQYSAADIERYHQGRMSAAEMHELEKASLDDPFLADALEGYVLATSSLNDDLTDLSERLQQRTTDPKVIPLQLENRKNFAWLRVAAMAILVFGAAFLVYQFGFNNKSGNIALRQTKEPGTSTPSVSEEERAIADSTKANFTDNIAGPDDTLKRSVSGGLTDTLTAAVINRNGVRINPPVSPVADKNVVGYGTQRINAGDSITARANPNPRIEETSGFAQVEARENKSLSGRAPGLDVDDAKSRKGYSAKFKQNNSSVVKPQEDSESLAANRVQQQNANIFRGRILDESNNALPFANITNMQDNVGTYSDARGNFVLTSPDSVLDVRVRSLGFESQSIGLRNGSQQLENTIVMQEASDRATDLVIIRQKSNAGRPRNSNMVLEEPEPVDGWHNYDMYIVNNLKVPESVKSRPTQNGEVELSFEVDQKGAPVNITVVRSLCESCDQEAIRLLKEGPKWRRKTKAGRTTVTITF